MFVIPGEPDCKVVGAIVSALKASGVERDDVRANVFATELAKQGVSVPVRCKNCKYLHGNSCYHSMSKFWLVPSGEHFCRNGEAR